MATQVRARDVARHESENVKQDFAVAVAQLTTALQTLATKLDADVNTSDTDYRAVIDALMTFVVTA